MIEVILGLSPLLLVVFIFFYYLNLHKTLSLSPRQSRPINPWFVWLGLLPFVGIIWNVVTSALISLDIRRRCIDHNVTCYGLVLMPAGIIASIFVGGATLPLAGPAIALIGAPAWILFWIVVAHCRTLLSSQLEARHTQSAFATPPENAAGDNLVVDETRTVPAAALHRRRNVGELMRVNLLRIGLVLLATAVAAYFVTDFRHAIWQDSGLWVEPTAKIQALASERAFSRNAVLFMIPVVLGCWIWSSENKKLILFLRKFRQDDVNRTLQHAMRQTIFRQFRLLTLDDATFHPITSNHAIQFAAIVAVIAACAALFATFGTVRVYLQDGLSGFAQAENLIKSSALQLLLFPLIAFEEPEMVMEYLDQVRSNPLATFLELYLHEVEMLAFFLIGFTTLYFGVGVFLGVLAAFYVVALMRLRLIGRSRVKNANALERFIKYAKRLKSRLYSPTIIAPPATVVAVETPIWQEAVLALAATADIVLCDISDYTENIQWEIEQMLARHCEKCVFIAQRWRFREWTDKTEKDPECKLAELGQSVKDKNPIIYENAKNLDLPQLTKVLESRLTRLNGKRE
ncbi:MAG: hypothetical protein JSW39_19970 [Desulfobacterales bacterium]|nr:MAG: hypothetical protein JSW39_19970 [Desulfobacterales bacterium]